jgi:hypothetical protein
MLRNLARDGMFCLYERLWVKVSPFRYNNLSFSGFGEFDGIGCALDTVGSETSLIMNIFCFYSSYLCQSTLRSRAGYCGLNWGFRLF